MFFTTGKQTQLQKDRTRFQQMLMFLYYTMFVTFLINFILIPFQALPLVGGIAPDA